MHDEPRTFNLSDLGNSERFVAQHSDRVRYIHATSTWLVWDGRRWAADQDAEVQRLAAATMRTIYTEAERVADSDERRRLARHAIASEGRRGVHDMLELAKSMLPIAARPEMFDGPSTDFLLNVENGTIDLRSGALRVHSPDDHITRLAPVEFKPDARSPVWDAFLEQQVPDKELRAYLNRATGYTLTGSTRDE